MTKHDEIEEQLIETVDEEGNIINFELIDIIDMDGKEYVVAFDNISRAKIVITDELWEKYQAEHETVEL